MENKNNLTIISHNCASYFLYNKLGWEYTSPFIDLYIDHVNYLYLLKNFSEINFENVRLVNKTMYLNNGGYNCANENQFYPIVCLDNKVIMHAIHCIGWQEFYNKWIRRVKKINFHNLLFIYYDNINKKDKLKKFLDYTSDYNRLVYSKNFVDEDDYTFLYQDCTKEFDIQFVNQSFDDERLMKFIQTRKGIQIEDLL